MLVERYEVGEKEDRKRLRIQIIINGTVG